METNSFWKEEYRLIRGDEFTSKSLEKLVSCLKDLPWARSSILGVFGLALKIVLYIDHLLLQGACFAVAYQYGRRVKDSERYSSCTFDYHL